MNHISAATAASELAADAEGDEGLSTEYVCGSDELCLKKTAESLVLIREEVMLAATRADSRDRF